jgi:hypothetical protein
MVLCSRDAKSDHVAGNSSVLYRLAIVVKVELETES